MSRTDFKKNEESRDKITKPDSVQFFQFSIILASMKLRKNIKNDDVYLFYFETLRLEIWHACSYM